MLICPQLGTCSPEGHCLTAGTEEGDGSHTVAQHLLLDFLADRQQQRDPALASSARSFLTCRLFADELTALRAAGTPSSERQSQVLQRYQTLTEQLNKGLKCDMNAGVGNIPSMSFSFLLGQVTRQVTMTF